MCKIKSESKQSQWNNSLKSFMIWQSMGTFLESAIQLMPVRHHYRGKITSVCLLLVLLCKRRGSNTTHERIWRKRCKLLQRLHFIGWKASFPRELSPRTDESRTLAWFEKSWASVPESFDRNAHTAATSPFLRSLPSLWFYLLWGLWTRTQNHSSWRGAARRTESLCVKHLSKQSYIMSTQLATLSSGGSK